MLLVPLFSCWCDCSVPLLLFTVVATVHLLLLLFTVLATVHCCSGGRCHAPDCEQHAGHAPTSVLRSHCLHCELPCRQAYRWYTHSMFSLLSLRNPCDGYSAESPGQKEPHSLLLPTQSLCLFRLSLPSPPLSPPLAGGREPGTALHVQCDDDGVHVPQRPGAEWSSPPPWGPPASRPSCLAPAGPTSGHSARP